MGEKVQQLFELFQSYRTVQPGHKMAPAPRERDLLLLRSEVTSLNKRLTIYPLPTCRREREREREMSE